MDALSQNDMIHESHIQRTLSCLPWLPSIKARRHLPSCITFPAHVTVGVGAWAVSFAQVRYYTSLSNGPMRKSVPASEASLSLERTRLAEAQPQGDVSTNCHDASQYSRMPRPLLFPSVIQGTGHPSDGTTSESFRVAVATRAIRTRFSLAQKGTRSRKKGEGEANAICRESLGYSVPDWHHRSWARRWRGQGVSAILLPASFRKLPCLLTCRVCLSELRRGGEERQRRPGAFLLSQCRTIETPHNAMPGRFWPPFLFSSNVPLSPFSSSTYSWESPNRKMLLVVKRATQRRRPR